MRRPYLLMLIVALVMAGAAAWIANRWIQGRGAPPPVAQVKTVPVIVATREIPFGHKIEAADVSVANWPQGNRPADSLSDTSQAIGKIAQRSFFEGEPIPSARLREHLGGSTLSALITENMRAITVRVNDVIGVAGFVLPGNRVDILVTRKAGGRGNADTETLLQDVKVLAVDQEVSPEKDKPAIVRAVTLEVDPVQAEQLATALTEGSLKLTLRNPLDREKTVAADKKPAPKPVRHLRSKQPSIEIIRGTERSHT